MHARGADADALLAATHAHAVELRAVEQLAEDQRDLFLDDARAVVLHADFETVLAGALDVDPDFGQDAGFFAGVQGVVDRLLDGGQQGLPRVVEAQQVAVLGKELADGNIALAGGHRLGGGSPAGFRCGYESRRWGRCRWNRPARWLHFRGGTNGQSWGSSSWCDRVQRAVTVQEPLSSCKRLADCEVRLPTISSCHLRFPSVAALGHDSRSFGLIRHRLRQS